MLDAQSDLLDGVTRIVAISILASSPPMLAERLNPIFGIEAPEATLIQPHSL